MRRLKDFIVLIVFVEVVVVVVAVDNDTTVEEFSTV
jgi:hypothetical protein